MMAKELSISTKKGRLDVFREIDRIRSREARKAVEELVRVTNDAMLDAVEVMTKMLPDALMTVYEIMNHGKRNDSVRLKAALAILGTFGISQKQKVEVTKRDGDLNANKDYFDDIRQELTKQVEHAQFSGTSKITKTDEMRTLQSKLT